MAKAWLTYARRDDGSYAIFWTQDLDRGPFHLLWDLSAEAVLEIRRSVQGKRHGVDALCDYTASFFPQFVESHPYSNGVGNPLNMSRHIQFPSYESLFVMTLEK